jgi:hypothetical protein
MQQTLSVVCGILLLAAPAAAQQAGGQQIGLAASIQREYANVKRFLTAEAASMPESEYGFRPTPEVRSYGQLFGHVANAQFNACSAVKGVANPNQGNNNEQKTTKAEFVKALADSFAFCDDAYASLTDQNATEMMKRGQNMQARGGILADNNGHNMEMYGIGTVYMRLKGLVPPSTEEEAARRGGAGRGGREGGRGRQ